MRIRYPTRSKFVDQIRATIKVERARLDSGRAVEVPLEPGGYGGDWIVVILPEHDEEFEVNGSMKDPTRFPQRIRAAALALHLEKASGRFRIIHYREDGIVTIRKDH